HEVYTSYTEAVQKRKGKYPAGITQDIGQRCSMFNKLSGGGQEVWHFKIFADSNKKRDPII
ncbi:MAG TPA: hypothetical protein VGK38_14790, partial [Prolixibacteraceae bacterium]